jgi:formate hydrogenlyase transcriptional activator
MEDDRLLSLAVAVAAERNLQDVLQTIVRGLASQPGVALARIWLLLPGDICDSCVLRDECHDRTQCLHLVASAGTPIHSQEEDWSFLDGRFRRIPINAYVAGYVGASGKAILIKDIASDHLHLARPEWVHLEGIRSIAAHPLIYRDRVLGVLGILTREPVDERAFSWLGTFANQAAVAISNAHAFEELERAHEALRESGARSSAILETSLDCIVTADHEGRILEFNHAAEETFGYLRAEVIGKLLVETIVPESMREGQSHGLTRIIDAGEFQLLGRRMETIARRSDGSEFPIELAISRVALPGPPIFTGFIRDITERKRAEEEVAGLRKRLELENAYLNEEVKERLAYGETVGTSPALSEVLQQVEIVARTDAAVLLTGESGTGKELAARAIHERSARRGRPLVTVNCASVPRELFESEFFGHVKGAFTGAVRDRIGRFQLADRGTIFLDEVGEIPLELQSKLLRVLQDQQVQRVGEDQVRQLDVRVIAATNHNLKEECEAGRFRRDLYFRLSVFPIELPPLRNRLEDIGLLAAHFLDLAKRRLNRPDVMLTDEALDLLTAYHWPGNIRELRNVIERAVILSQHGLLRIDLVLGTTASPARRSPTRRADDVAEVPGHPAGGKVLSQVELVRQERENIIAALEQADWRISGTGGAAEILGVKPTTLASRLKRFGIERPVRVLPQR